MTNRTELSTDAVEPWVLRLVEACTAMIEALDDRERDELMTLRLLDPDGYAGLSMRHLDDDFIEVAWVGRRLGAIRRAWLFEDES